MDPIGLLVGSTGQWKGVNTLHDPNTGKPEESPSEVTVTPLLGGKFARLDYTWAYQGTPQEGSLLVGFDPRSGEVSFHWIDTWHMGRGVLSCKGTMGDDSTIAARGSYAAPPGPDWGWRIEIEPGGTSLRIVHTNIFPDGKEEVAVVGAYERS